MSEEEKQKALDTGEIWTLQWYPETPVGFICVAASSLTVLLKAVKPPEKEGRYKYSFPFVK